MVKKTYTVHTRLNTKQIAALAKNKNVSHCSDIECDENNHLVQIDVPTLKARNKLQNMSKKGKGIRLNPNEMLDIRVHKGNGFFDSIRRVFSRAGDTIKNIVTNPVTKDIVKTITPIASQMAANAIKGGVTAYTGNPMAGEVAGNLANTGINAGSNAYTGSGMKKKGKGFFKGLKRIADSGITKAIVKEIAPTATNILANSVSNATGSNTAGNVVGALSGAAANQYTGSGMCKKGKGIVGYPKYGNGLEHIDNYAVTIGAQPERKNLNQFQDAQERMKYIRSFRKANM